MHARTHTHIRTYARTLSSISVYFVLCFHFHSNLLIYLLTMIIFPSHFQSAKAVYNRILDLKIATPQIIINFGLFLEENKYFEEAFKVYERGVSMFKWPQVYDIWNTYLTKFITRYGGTKLERARDLFEQCVENCPPKYAKCEFQGISTCVCTCIDGGWIWMG